MSKFYDWAYKRVVNICDFWQRNKPALSTIETVKETFERVVEERERLDEINKNLLQTSKPITEKKKKLKQAARNVQRKICTILSIYYIMQKDRENRERYEGYMLLLRTIRDADLVYNGRRLLKECEQLGETLWKAGILPEMITSLQTTTIQFEEIMDKPQEVAQKNYSLNKDRKETIKIVNAIIAKKLNPMMDAYFNTQNPDLYSEYSFIAKQTKIPRRTIAVRGTIIDKVTRNPLTDVIITIRKADIEHKCSGKTGQYLIRNLAAGIYDAEISKPEYQTLLIKLIHNGDATTIFDIELEPKHKFN